MASWRSRLTARYATHQPNSSFRRRCLTNPSLGFTRHVTVEYFQESFGMNARAGGGEAPKGGKGRINSVENPLTTYPLVGGKATKLYPDLLHTRSALILILCEGSIIPKDGIPEATPLRFYRVTHHEVFLNRTAKTARHSIFCSLTLQCRNA